MGAELAKQYADANETTILEMKKAIDENNIDFDYSPQSSYIYTKEDIYLQQIEDEVKVKFTGS